MKTLAIRLDDELHSRLSLLSKLSGTSVTDTIRTAIEKHLTQLTADPAIAGKAAELTDEIDREAAEQRQALAAIFGNPPGDPKKPAARRSPSRE